MTTVATAETEKTEGSGTVQMGNDGVPGFPQLIGTFMGRDALSLAVSYLGLTEHDTVLLPVYTCQDVLRSFVRKCHVVFYDVGNDVTIDPDVLRAKLRTQGRIRMALITNYFGFLQPFRREIKDLCVENDIRLVEDCAHSLLSEGSGETGDLSTYSLRKILPIRDGGGLRVNYGGFAVPRYHTALYSNTLSFLAFAKSLLNVHSEQFSRARVSSQTTKVFPLPSADSLVLPLSTFARRSISKISIDKVVQQRRDDFRFWQEATRGNSELIPIFRDLPPGICPFGFPMRIKYREALETRVKENGISLRVHWRLDKEMGSECGVSHQLAREMITLPLYPELDPKEREVLAGLVTRA